MMRCRGRWTSRLSFGGPLLICGVLPRRYEDSRALAIPRPAADNAMIRIYLRTRFVVDLFFSKICVCVVCAKGALTG